MSAANKEKDVNPKSEKEPERRCKKCGVRSDDISQCKNCYVDFLIDSVEGDIDEIKDLVHENLYGDEFDDEPPVVSEDAITRYSLQMDVSLKASETELEELKVLHKAGKVAGGSDRPLKRSRTAENNDNDATSSGGGETQFEAKITKPSFKPKTFIMHSGVKFGDYKLNDVYAQRFEDVMEECGIIISNQYARVKFASTVCGVFHEAYILGFNHGLSEAQKKAAAAAKSTPPSN